MKRSREIVTNVAVGIAMTVFFHDPVASPERMWVSVVAEMIAQLAARPAGLLHPRMYPLACAYEMT